MPVIDKDLREKILTRTATESYTIGTLAHKMGMGVNTLGTIINNYDPNKEWRTDTYAKLVEYAKGKSLDEIKHPLQAATGMQPQGKSNSLVPASQNESVALLKEKVDSLIDLVGLYKDQVSLLKVLIKEHEEVRNDAIKRSIMNQQSHDKKIDEQIQNLENNFETMNKHLLYRKSSTKELESRVNKIEIKLDPTKIHKHHTEVKNADQ